MLMQNTKVLDLDTKKKKIIMVLCCIQECAVEVNNTDNAAELDFLLEFIRENNKSQKITKQLQEEVGNSNDGFFLKML